MDLKIRQHFSELKITGQRIMISPVEKKTKDLELIDYLKSVIENREVFEFEDIGFCYWNISDNYALLRDGHALRENHQSFYECIMEYDSSYLWWLVCDATQRLTLEKDGYSDWWWSVYREAVLRGSDDTNHFVEFGAHRAALYRNAVLFPKQNYVTLAKTSYEAFLDKTKNKAEYSFYKIMYQSLISRYFFVDNNEIRDMGESLLPNLAYSDSPRDFLVGEWESFITPFGKHKCAVVGITSAVNALIDNNGTELARELYCLACENGLPRSTYVEKRL